MIDVRLAVCLGKYLNINVLQCHILFGIAFFKSRSLLKYHEYVSIYFLVQYIHCLVSQTFSVLCTETDYSQ